MSPIDKPAGEKYWKITFYPGGQRFRRSLKVEAKSHARKIQQPPLFPIRLDNTVMETNISWAADIRRTRHIGDFTRWKDHDAYQKGFERLLRDLRGEQSRQRK